MPHNKRDPRRATRGLKFLVFAVVIGVIAVLRQVGIEPGSPLGLVLVGASIIVLTLVVCYALLRW